MLNEQIVSKILTSKKYEALYPKTVERIVEDSIKRYGDKRAEEKSKELLHQIWGSFYRTRPDFKKLLSKFSFADYELSDLRLIDDLLRIHSSTVERMKFIEEFYQKIFKVTGIPNTIQDIGCGFTSLSIKHMAIPKTTKYVGYDIDLEEISFLKKISKILFPEYDLTFKAADVLSDDFEYSDVIFLLKTIPVLERQLKGSTQQVLKKLKFKYLVISFPLKSLSGREVGMGEFYSKQFEDIIKSWEYEKIGFENELVYILKSKKQYE